MSELKATTIYDAYWKATSDGDNSIPVYLKEEADKVIAEKDEEIRKLNFQMWSARCEAAAAERDEPRLARCRYMADKFKEVTK